MKIAAIIRIDKKLAYIIYFFSKILFLYTCKLLFTGASTVLATKIYSVSLNSESLSLIACRSKKRTKVPKISSNTSIS